MSRNLGNQLPDALLEKLHQGNLYREGGLGLAVLTLDEQGRPHVAMAPGAVAAKSGTVYVALGAASSSLNNAIRDPRVTLQVAGPDTLYYIKGRAALIRPEMQVMAQEAALRLDVDEVLEDTESFVRITGGISYQYRVMHDDFILVIRAMLDELAALAAEEK